MIVQWFADMFYKVLTALLGFINLPEMNTELVDSIFYHVDLIIENGFVLFKFFIPDYVIRVCFPAVGIILGFKYGYYFVMWILKKIPAVGIN